MLQIFDNETFGVKRLTLSFLDGSIQVNPRGTNGAQTG